MISAITKPMSTIARVLRLSSLKVEILKKQAAAVHVLQFLAVRLTNNELTKNLIDVVGLEKSLPKIRSVNIFLHSPDQRLASGKKKTNVFAWNFNTKTSKQICSVHSQLA